MEGGGEELGVGNNRNSFFFLLWTSIYVNVVSYADFVFGNEPSGTRVVIGFVTRLKVSNFEKEHLFFLWIMKVLGELPFGKVVM